MDKPLKDAFDHAQKELTHLNYRWIMFVQLFGTNSHRIRLINQTASNLLSEFQWLVIDSMVLGLSKFTDPAKMKGNSNLSFLYFIEEIDKAEKGGIADELRQLLNELDAAVEKFRAIRNKKIAHNDLAVALGSADSPLPGASRSDVNKALRIAGEFLNKIELNYFNSNTAYENTILPLHNDGRSLLIRLQKSLAYDQLAAEGVIDWNKWEELGDIDEKTA